MNLRDITWDDGKYGCFAGYIGKRPVCTVTWMSTTRDDPKPWKLHAEAFGFRLGREYADREEAKADAPRAILALIRGLLAE